MALISCPNCGNNISDKAEKCPKCGYSMHNGSENKRIEAINVDTRAEEARKAGETRRTEEAKRAGKIRQNKNEEISPKRASAETNDSDYSKEAEGRTTDSLNSTQKSIASTLPIILSVLSLVVSVVVLFVLVKVVNKIDNISINDNGVLASSTSHSFSEEEPEKKEADIADGTVDDRQESDVEEDIADEQQASAENNEKRGN